LWANFRALIGISSQRVEPSLAIWANPVQFSFRAGRRQAGRRRGGPTWSEAAAFGSTVQCWSPSLFMKQYRWPSCARRPARSAPKVKFTGLTQNSQVDPAVD
jgi:hypothetical protein